MRGERGPAPVGAAAAAASLERPRGSEKKPLGLVTGGPSGLPRFYSVDLG